MSNNLDVIFTAKQRSHNAIGFIKRCMIQLVVTGLGTFVTFIAVGMLEPHFEGQGIGADVVLFLLHYGSLLLLFMLGVYVTFITFAIPYKAREYVKLQSLIKELKKAEGIGLPDFKSVAK